MIQNSFFTMEPAFVEILRDAGIGPARDLASWVSGGWGGLVRIGFDKATSAQFTLQWDPKVLRYTGVGGFGLPGLTAANFGTASVKEGKLSFSWDDPQGMGATLPEGSTMFNASFHVIGQPGSVSPLMLRDSPTPREACVAFKLARISTQDGKAAVIASRPAIQVAPSAAGSPLTLSIPTRNGLCYTLEYTDSLSNPKWTPLEVIIGDGTVRGFPQIAPTNLHGFYRVLAQEDND